MVKLERNIPKNLMLRLWPSWTESSELCFGRREFFRVQFSGSGMRCGVSAAQAGGEFPLPPHQFVWDWEHNFPQAAPALPRSSETGNTWNCCQSITQAVAQPQSLAATSIWPSARGTGQDSGSSFAASRGNLSGAGG